ncbi:beta-ureidopropionase [Iris pallida]|uniref:Beta-ureidopropionase n=1 Tax=Iris pallida TaxID=29817 RepID=A0AAX6HP77_IRIPA|nr:beta-ureidopropionase [Iris pallida]
MIEKGKVEHYKGFYSEFQTEEHVLKVFDDISMKKEGTVSVCLVPNSITLSTSIPFLDQKKAILGKVKPVTDVAGVSCVNFWRLHEAWMIPFAFYTREKRWCKFARLVDREPTQFLQDLV